jgi:hypothetical protein
MGVTWTGETRVACGLRVWSRRPHDGAERCLLGLFDAAAGGLAEWSEFDVEGSSVLASRSVGSPAKT